MLYRFLRLITIFFLIVSPYFFGLFLVDKDPTSVDNLTLGFNLLFYIPFIAVTGIIVSIVVRKRKNADLLSFLGYAIPAVLVFLHELVIL